MIERVPRWVFERWPGAKGILVNTNYRNQGEWFYIGTNLDELKCYLDRMLHHQVWHVDMSGNVIEPLGRGGERV